MTKNVLWALLGLVAACGGSSAPPASTASAPASSGAAPAGSNAAAGQAPTNDQMKAVLKEHTRELKACYDREKDRGMSYKGQTKFKVKIAPDGKVTDVQGVDVTPDAEFLSSCVSESMKSWTFPPSAGGSSAVVPVAW